MDYDTSSTAAAANTKGLEILTKQTALTEIYIPSVFIKTVNTVTFDLDVYEGTTLYKTISVDAIADEEQEVVIELTSRNAKISITTDNDEVIFYNGYLTDSEYTKLSSYNTFASSCSGCGQRNNTGFINIKGIIDGTTLYALIGVRPNVIVTCGMENAFCYLIQDLKQAFLLRSGIEILKEFITSDRATHFAMNGKDMANGLITAWTEQYDRILRTKAKGLANTLRRLDPICFKCGGLTYATSRP
jgi:hypothetical protein